jgi:hypothetical protein
MEASLHPAVTRHPFSARAKGRSGWAVTITDLDHRDLITAHIIA